MKPSMRRLPLLLLILVTILVHPPGRITAAGPDQEAGLAGRPLIVALRDDLPPFAFLSVEKQPAGLFVDIWRLWAARTGQPIAFQVFAWKDNLQSLKDGSVDAIGALTFSDDREPWIAFSEPLYQIRLKVFRPKTSNTSMELSRFKGLKVGLVGRTSLDDNLRDDYPDLDIVTFASLEETIYAAREGSIDAFISVPTSVDTILMRLGLVGEFEATEEILYPRTIYAGVRKDRSKLLASIDHGFDLLSMDELGEIERRWLPDPASRHYSNLPELRLTVEERAWVKRHPQVKLAVSAGFAPFSFLGEDGKAAGMGTDYLELLKKRTGIDMKIVKTAPWKALMASLEEETIDGVACAARTVERERVLAFTRSYLSLPWVIISRDDFPFYNADLKDLSGKRIAVLSPSPLAELLHRRPDLELVGVNTVEDIWETVSLGKADAGISNLASASYYISRKGISNLKVAGVLNDQLNLGLAIRKDWPELVGILNKAIATITPEEHTAVQKQWMSVHYEVGPAWRVVRWWVISTAALAACILIVTMLLWNRRPTREVKERERVEKALRKSETEYRILADNTYDWEFWLGPDGRFVYVSPSCLRITGHSREEFTADPALFRSLVHPDDRSGFDEHVREVLDKRKPCGDEHQFRVMGSDGAYRWIGHVCQPVFDDDGRFRGIRGSHRDISQIKADEEKLKESRQQLADIIDFLPDASLIIDKDRRVIAWNRAMEEMTGIRAEEMLGKGNYEYALPFYGERRPILVDLALDPEADGEKHYAAVKRSGDVIHGEAFVSHLASGTAYLSATASVLRDGSGNVVAAIQCIRDRTDRRRAEEALRDSEARYREFFTTSRDAVFITTPEGRWVDFNDSAVALFGFDTRQELEQVPVTALYEHLEERAAFLTSIEDTGFCKDYPVRLKKKDGSVMDTLISAVTLRSQDGLVKSFLGTIRDITEHKKALETRRSLEERLQRAEKMEALGTLAGGVAHDLNNVLGIIAGFSELLLTGDYDPMEAKPLITAIEQSAHRAAAIVQDLLTLARRGVRTTQVLNLNKIIHACLESPEAVKLALDHPEVRIRSELETDLLNVSGSPIHLGKSILNLLLNAVEAMPAGGSIIVKTVNRYLDRPISGYDEVREGDYVVLSISDTGKGIAAADLKRIFEPFYTRKVMGRSGTGLGLAVVWGTVKDHQGYINVESREGKGTTFTLYFPVTREAAIPEQVAVSAADYMGKGERLLVVDDVEGQRELAGTMLRKLNYNAETVSSGEEAVAYLKRHKVDLVVLDMIMDPGMDGLDAYIEILELHPRQKAIIVSGFAETERVRQAQALGAGKYLRKPYVLEKLGLAVREELDRSA